ncbi:MAG: hypothetical protein OIF50_09375 [Flavobacteriaceae bacterium]|nr:hypothetical protein [Flavobacteriaceae bacterium]
MKDLQHNLFLLFCMLIIVPLPAQKGPGGVGEPNGTTSLKIWYSADFGIQANNRNRVSEWTNRAGISDLNMKETGSRRPTRQNNQLNGYPQIRFNGVNRLRSKKKLTPTNFVTNQTTAFSVVVADTPNQASSVFTTDPLDGMRFNHHAPWVYDVTFDIGVCCPTTNRVFLNNPPGLTNYSMWSFSASASQNKQLYRNGGLLINNAGVGTFNNHANYRFNLGGHTAGAYGFRGAMTEIIIFNKRIEEVQRIIIENYLSAKYGLTTASNDIYIQDNAANGNFDHDVAGIGRISNQSHTSAQGTGIVRMWNPQNLNNNEFLLWGHDNGSLQALIQNDVPDSMENRLSRIWRVSELATNGNAVDVGAHHLSIDTQGIANAKDLLLLVDTDNDGSFTDEHPIASSSYNTSTHIAQYNNLQQLSNGCRFTFGFPVPSIITNRNKTYRVNKND